MSDAIQLELNIENKSPEEMRFYLMQKQINEMSDSMGKVRRRLFSEIGEMKKICAALQKENDDLKAALKEVKHGKSQWSYGHDGNLFDITTLQEAVG